MSRSVLCATLLVLASAVPAQRKDLYDPSKVRLVELTFKQSDWWSQLSTNWSRKIYIKAELKIEGEVYRDVGVRFRGNSSYWGISRSSRKKPFKIAIDAFQDGKLWGYKTLNFNNNFMDPTMTREVLGYEIMRKYTPAPRSNYITLKINGQNWGPYVNTQQINKDLLRQWFPSEDGNRYRGERQSGRYHPNYTGFNWYGQNVAEYKKGFELKSEQNPSPWVDLINACNVLNNTPAAQLPAALPREFDMDNVLTVFALGNTLLWLDSYVGRYCHNIYCYRDEKHGVFSLLPWDMNNVFGGYTDGNSHSALPRLSPYYVYLRSGNRRPLFTRSMAHRPFKEHFIAKARVIAEELHWSGRIAPRIAQLQNMIRAAMQADPYRLYPMSSFTSNLTNSYRVSFFANVPGLRPVIEGRHAYLKAHPDLTRPAPVLTDLAHTPARPTPADTTWVTVRASGAAKVELRHRVRGRFIDSPMFDDGKHRDGAANDGVFGAAIPAQLAGTTVDYHVRATTGAGVVAFAPATAAFQGPSYRVGWPRRSSPIFINELLARNVNGITDEKGEHEDWLELVNTGTGPFDVSGMHLSDNLGNPRKWQVPANTVIPAAGTLLVWCDEDESDGKLHASFKLSGGGEEVGLFDVTGRFLLDHVAFGPQEDDVSTARLFDGQSVWVTLLGPTPNALNAPPICGTRAYSALDSTAHRSRLTLAGVPKIGTTPTLQLRGGLPNNVYLLFLSGQPGYVPLPNDVVFLTGTSLALLLVPSDAAGNASVPLAIPDAAGLAGKRIFLQGLGIGGSGLWASNALGIGFCPK